MCRAKLFSNRPATRGMAAKLAKLRARSRAELHLLAEAVLWLAVARAAILILPFHWTKRLFALTPGSGAAVTDLAQLGVAKKIGWAVTAASIRTPWRSACLAQSLAGAAMLSRRAIPAHIALGVATSRGTGALEAHAWLSSGGMILTGAPGHQRYRVIANFSLG